MARRCKEALHSRADNRNLARDAVNSQRVLQWRSLLEEFQPQFHCIKGTDNAVADALSRLPMSSGQRAPGPNQSKLPSNQEPSSDDKNNGFSIPRDCRVMRWSVSSTAQQSPKSTHSQKRHVVTKPWKQTKFIWQIPSESRSKPRLSRPRSKRAFQRAHSQRSDGQHHSFLSPCTQSRWHDKTPRHHRTSFLSSTLTTARRKSDAST